MDKTKIDNAIEVINLSILMREDQIKNEPNESIWKDERLQLIHAKELIQMDIESMVE